MNTYVATAPGNKAVTLEAPSQAAAWRECKRNGWRYDGRLRRDESELERELARLGLR